MLDCEANQTTNKFQSDVTNERVSIEMYSTDAQWQMFLIYKTINQVDESLQLIQPWLMQAKVTKLSNLTVTIDS